MLCMSSWAIRLFDNNVSIGYAVDSVLHCSRRYNHNNITDYPVQVIVARACTLKLQAV